jgi:cysteinyl-tRNA synthetase
MALQLYDTRSRTVRVFTPLVPGAVSIYVCGPTVQAPPHIGHLRSAVAFDVLRRWLLAGGSTVTFIRNVTDIDDKIIAVSAQERVPYWQVAERNHRAFTQAYDALGVLPPTGEPHATGHVPQMVALIEALIARGHAYPGVGGDVWFSVTSDPEYGALSGQRLDAVQPSADGEAAGKRDSRDFALWKGAKPGEPHWPTPWGEGRPGWHLECSAMAEDRLGETFDIHGGGLDLVFPHHENELAQSHCAGYGFARYWMHNGLVNIGGAKMSKSLGNSLLAADLLERVRPQVLRYVLGAPQPRSTLDWSEDVLVEGEAAYSRIETFVRNALDLLGGVPDDEPAATAAADWERFATALDDDLAVPRALAVVHEAVRRGNAELTARDLVAVRGTLGGVRRMLTVLGLDPVLQWPAAGASLEPVVDALVGLVGEVRQQARAAKDWATADRLRDQLAAAGLVVEDTPEGLRWRLAVAPGH